ncbi:unnamed protein product [Bursaphelenchus okinawaensis]|uniref:Peptidase A1 domain-containing protein n=1 Tax=Bursaphelenchus okinawaensis TaxID=465554 RepID=A0A811L0N8_9BILA|nr:unnamed protein product [Bursaphelenchus okinawaensis]CAG9114400.1 unnamed protein product [Bursaphelenchus okinawaensis]
MKTLCIVLVFAALVGALEYDQETSKVTLTVGKEEKNDLKFQLTLANDDILVFGPECKEDFSCSQHGHPYYDAAKDKHALEDGENKWTLFKTKLAKDLEINGGAKTSKLDVNVIVGLVDETNKGNDYSFDASLGLKSGKDKPFDKLVSAYGRNDQYLLLVPKLKCAGLKKFCGKFTLVESTSDVWTNDFTYKIDAKDVTFKAAAAFEDKYVASTKALSLFGKAKITEDDYKELTKFNVKYGDVEEVTVGDKQGFDLGLPNSLFEKHCLKLAKDGDKYKVGLAERHNGVGFAAASLAALMEMFALLQL